MILGHVENGRTAQVEFYFYTGEVGVQEYDDRTELAFYGSNRSVEGPVDGLLDGQPVTVQDVRVRGLGGATNSKLVAVTLIVLKVN